MGQCKWSTPPATAWLSSRIPGFIAAQNEKGPTGKGTQAVSQYKRETRDLFFEMWTPEREAREWAEAEEKAVEEEQAEMVAAGRSTLSAAQVTKRDSRLKEANEREVFASHDEWKQKRISVSLILYAMKAKRVLIVPQQLRSWFYNHHPRKKSNEPTIKIVLGNERERGVLSQTQIYSKSHYGRVKQEADIEASSLAPHMQLQARNKTIARALEAESQEVKDEVKRMYEKMKQERAENIAALKTVFTMASSDMDPTPLDRFR